MKKKIICFLLLSLSILLLFAGCGKEKRSLTYIVDGVEYAKHELADENAELSPLKEEPTKEGYLFGGWYYDYGKWEHKFDISTYNLEKYKGEYKVYAKWEVVELEYNSTGRYYTVTKLLSGSAGMEEIKIPSHYKDFPVAAIGDAVFRGKDNLTSVIIPDTVKQIGEEAFAYCTALKKVVLPNSVVEMGNGIFAGCTALESVTLPISAASGVTPMTVISARAFEGCVSLTSVTLPEKITTIGGRAFADCVSLKEINLSQRLEKIYNYAFLNCKALTEVKLPKYVTEIGDYAFKDCAALSSLVFHEDCKMSITLRRGFISGCEKITSLYLTGEVALVDSGAFENTPNLASLSMRMPTCIFSGAFQGTGLTKLTLRNQSSEWNLGSILYQDNWHAGVITAVVFDDREITVTTE